jgi:hypothetical protein
MVGSPMETVNLGSGNDTVTVNAVTVGATIGNGTGRNTLQVTGGGTVAMGSNITDIATALLAPASTPYAFTANSIGGLVVNDTSTTADTLQAGGPNQTLTGGAAGKLTMIGAAAGGDLFKDMTALLNQDTVAGFTAPGDAIDFTDLKDIAGVIRSFTENNAGTAGILKVSDGTHSASVALLGQYMASAFVATQDTSGLGTIVSYEPQHQPVIAPPH